MEIRLMEGFRQRTHRRAVCFHSIYLLVVCRWQDPSYPIFLSLDRLGLLFRSRRAVGLPVDFRQAISLRLFAHPLHQRLVRLLAPLWDPLGSDSPFPCSFGFFSPEGSCSLPGTDAGMS